MFLDHRLAGPGAVGFLGDDLPLAQTADDLEREEGIAVGLDADLCCQLLREPLGAQRVFEQCDKMLGAQARELHTIEMARSLQIGNPVLRDAGSARADQKESVSRCGQAQTRKQRAPSSGAKWRSSISTMVGRSAARRAWRARKPSAASPS